MARRRRLFGVISAALALLLEVTKPGDGNGDGKIWLPITLW